MICWCRRRFVAIQAKHLPSPQTPPAHQIIAQKNCARASQAAGRPTLPQPGGGFKGGVQQRLSVSCQTSPLPTPSTLVRSKPVCLCDLVSRDEQQQGGLACTILFVYPPPSSR